MLCTLSAHLITCGSATHGEKTQNSKNLEQEKKKNEKHVPQKLKYKKSQNFKKNPI